MTGQTNSESSDRDHRVDEIIAAYLEAVAAGKAPDRQALLAQHPELAAELSAFFGDHDAVRELARPMQAAPAAAGEPTLAFDEGGQAAAGEATLAPGEQRPAGKPLGTVRYFGDYELLEEIARGGMGVVYKARQVKLNRIVAVKMILTGQLASEADVKRFYAEAEAAADLHHPNIVAIHEVGEHQGQHYFSMDYVEGQSLAALVREHPLSPTQAARYVRLIAEAIQHAHDKGVLHRDLKPSNVLIDKSDQPRVTDFGLAKRQDPARDNPAADAAGSPAGGLTVTGQVMGTPGYMPPEQARGERGRPLGGYLFAGSNPVRAADGPGAVRGRQHAGHTGQGHQRGAGVAAAAATERAARSGDDLPEMFAKGAGGAVCQCGGVGGGLAAFPGGRADLGPAGGPHGTDAQVGAAASGAGDRGPFGDGADLRGRYRCRYRLIVV